MIWLWLQKHAAFVANSYRRRADGRTSWEAAFGCGYKGELVPFGETCHFKVPTSHAREIADGVLRPAAPPRLLPFLVVNSWAIFTSFNIMAVAHPPHFAELAKRIDASMPYFHFLNTVGHFVPGVVGLWWFAKLENRAAACAWTSVVPLHVASLAFHLMWALRVAGADAIRFHAA